jgi:hypothetical protein
MQELAEHLKVSDSFRYPLDDYFRKREDIETGRSLYAGDFMIISEKYAEKEDLDQIIRSKFGDAYRLIAWNDLLAISTDMEGWADSLGLTEGEENAPMIFNDGYRIWLGRQYYPTRFNHNKPQHFLPFGTIDNDFICLGSRFGI